MFAPFGAVEIKRLFSGHGIYADGLCFAVELRGEIRVRGDAASAEAFEAAGARRWVYERPTGHKASMPFWALPETALDDEDELISWCKQALAAARRAAVTKRAKAPRKGSAAKRTISPTQSP